MRGYLSRRRPLLRWLAALALFHFFKNLDLGSNRFINGLAGTTLGVYILHQVPVLRDFLWNGIFHAQAHHGSAAYTLLVIVLTFVMYAYLRFSKQGYEISVVGESENTARYAGINVRRVTVRTMLISGAICGLCGFLIVAGKDQTISTASANGRGFTAIIVAWLGKLNPFTMVFVAFFLVFMEKGAGQIATQFNLNENASDIITGIILFFILGSEFFINYRVIPRGAHKEGK